MLNNRAIDREEFSFTVENTNVTIIYLDRGGFFYHINKTHSTNFTGSLWRMIR